MVGKNWRDLFDMVIVQADKPNFFTDRRKYVSRALLPGPWALLQGTAPLPDRKQGFAKHSLAPGSIQPSNVLSDTL